MTRSPLPFVLSLAACFGAPAPTPTIDATTEPSTSSTADTSTAPAPLSTALQLDRMLAHLDRFQAIADDHGGHRSILSPGYLASADYVAEELADYGYDVRREAVPIALYVNDEAAFAQTSPDAVTYETGVEYVVSQFSGNGDIAADLVAIDPLLPPGPTPNSSTAGCEATDFDGFPSGAVALIQRGTCTFAAKYQNAVSAGASAVVFFNEGQKGRTAPFVTQVGPGTLAAIPAVAIGYDLGETLATAPTPAVTLTVEGRTRTGTDENVIAETAGDPNQVVLVGAHLDSVPQGPGINDNGSGAAFVLELARLFAERGSDPQQQVRFAFWGAEESGLVGSGAWLTDPATGGVDKAKVASLSAYLNFDMMASPNGVRFVIDGDGSDVPDIRYPAGSDAIEQRFLDWFAAEGLPTAPSSAVTRFDTYWFAITGVPVGGVFSGAEALKTEAQAATFGGTAGLAYDACYHQACDTRDNVDPVLYEQLARAAAHVSEQLADPGPDAAPGRRSAAGAERGDLAPRMPPAATGTCHHRVPTLIE